MKDDFGTDAAIGEGPDGDELEGLTVPIWPYCLDDGFLAITELARARLELFSLEMVFRRTADAS